MLSTLQHPNIVRYVGTLREKRSLYIFLEYVAGGSIASMLARFGRFEETVIRLYTKQILEGLAYLHSNRTVSAHPAETLDGAGPAASVVADVCSHECAELRVWLR